MKAIGNTLIVIALAGAVLGLLALVPVFVMNVGSAWERNAHTGLFRFYSALYYADHPENVKRWLAAKAFGKRATRLAKRPRSTQVQGADLAGKP
jgi:hypothetical protein